MFFAPIDLEVDKLSDESIANAIRYTIATKYTHVNVSGINAVLQIFYNNHTKLKSLNCFFNPEGPRKILKRDNLYGANLIESTSLKEKNYHDRMEYSHIELCLKFENTGNYFIIVSDYNNFGWFEFYVKINKANEERHVYKLLKKISELNKKLLQNLRRFITIYISKTELEYIEDGQMNEYHNESRQSLINKYHNVEFVATIRPLINYGSYEFYLDREGVTREIII